MRSDFPKLRCYLMVSGNTLRSIPETTILWIFGEGIVFKRFHKIITLLMRKSYDSIFPLCPVLKEYEIMKAK